MTPKTATSHLVCYLLFLVLIGCNKAKPGSGSSSGAAGPAPAPGPMNVTVVKPTKKATFTRTIEQPGRVEPAEQAALAARTTGYVDEVRVDIGDTVVKGDVLILLALPEVQQELEQKKAQVDQAKAVIDQMDKAVLSAKARLAECKAGRDQAKYTLERWEKEYTRTARLVSERVLDNQTKDEAEKQRDSSKAGVALADAKLKSAEADEGKADADLRAARSHLRVAEADRDRVAALLKYREITAPFDGVITQRMVDPGHLAQPQGQGGKNNNLLVIVKKQAPRIFVNVPDIDAPWVHKECAASVRFGGRELPGKVVRLSGALDAQERTLRTEIALLDSADSIPLNAYIHATIKVVHQDVFTLPTTAIVTEKDQSYCFLIEGGKAVKTAVHLGPREEGVVELLRKKVKLSDQPRWAEWDGGESVAGNPAILKDGQEVKVAEK